LSLGVLLGMRLEEAADWLHSNGYPKPLIQSTQSPRGELRGDDVRVIRALWRDEVPLLTVAVFQTQTIGE